MPANEENPSRATTAVRAFGGSAVALVVAGTVALSIRQPWLFPSLGPAVMLHVEQPGKPESSPRNTQLVIVFAAVLLVTAVDRLFNRATGRPMPLWRGPSEEG